MGRRKTEEIRRAFEQELPKLRRDGVTLNPGKWGPFKRLVRAHGLGGFDFEVLDGRALRLCVHGKALVGQRTEETPVVTEPERSRRRDGCSCSARTGEH